MLTLSLELKILCENIAFVLNYKYKKHNFPQLLIGHNYAHLKSGAFSLDMCIDKRLSRISCAITSSRNIVLNPHPTTIYVYENVVCFLHLFHISAFQIRFLHGCTL